MDTLSVEEVLIIRRRLARNAMAGRDFGDTRPSNGNNLESAVSRQDAGFGGRRKHESTCGVAATLFYGLVLNHAFENGNKRTALVALLAFLERNRVVLVDTTEDDLYDLSLAVASHAVAGPDRQDADTEVAAVQKWLESRTRAKVVGDRSMHFRDLAEQLEGLGCRFGAPAGNFVKVFRDTDAGTYSAKMGYPSANFTVGVHDVKRVRKALRLDEVHGMDSAAFYDFQAMVDTFVNEYRQVLDRLAET